MSDDAVITRNSDKATQGEATASAQTEPGHLVERANTDGDYGPHGTDGDVHPFIFAGLAFDPNIEKSDSISADERFVLWHAPQGSGVRIDCLSSESISENDYVVSNGDGRLRSYVSGTDPSASVVGQAVEGTSGADERFEVEV